jgi:hypothetical protein
MSHAGKAGDPAGSPPTSRDAGARALQNADSDQQPRSSRVKTLAPPPPLAAFQQRATPPVAPTPEIPSFVRDPRPATAALPQLVQPLDPVWSEPVVDPYLSSLGPTKPRTRAWGFVVAFGLGGLTAVAVVFAVTMVKPTDQAASARATVQRSGSPTRVEPTQPRLTLPAPIDAPSPTAAGEPRTAPVSAPDPADAPALPAAQAQPTAAAEAVALVEPSAPAVSPRAIRSARSAAVPRPQHVTAGSRRSQPVGSDTPTSLDTAHVSEVLPEQPTRDEIKRALEAIRPALKTCIGGAHGTTFANVTIASSGRVGHASIEGAFAGTPEGSCMARALRSATVPRFAADSMTVRFPYVL